MIFNGIKINPFVLATVLLYFLAAFWYFKQGGPRMSWVFICYGFSNIAILSLGVK